MQQYLKYIDYHALGGTAKNELAFNRAELKARMKIDSLTHNRLRDLDPLPEIVPKLVLELIETGYCGSLDGIELTGTSNEGRSQSFASNDGKAEKLILEWLAGEEIDGVPLVDAGGIKFSPVLRV